MRARKLVLLLASAGFLLGSVVSAAAQTSPPMGATNVSTSDPASDDWRERAMQARAEVPDDAPNGDWRERAMLARAEVPDEAPNGRLRDPEGLADLAEAGMPDAAELAADRTDGRKSGE